MACARGRGRACVQSNHTAPRPFIVGVAGRREEASEGVVAGGCTVGERCTVVFHSHYRNVLPSALVAPRNKSSVTVTMDGAQGGYGCSRGELGCYCGAPESSTALPHGVRINPRAIDVTRSVHNNRNLFFLSFYHCSYLKFFLPRRDRTPGNHDNDSVVQNLRQSHGVN